MTIFKILLGLVVALALPVMGREIPKVLCVIFTSNHCPDAVAAANRTEPTSSRR